MEKRVSRDEGGGGVASRVSGDREDDEAGDGEDMDTMIHSNSADNKKGELDEKCREFSRLRDELLRSKRAVRVLTGSEAVQVRE